MEKRRAQPMRPANRWKEARTTSSILRRADRCARSYAVPRIRLTVPGWKRRWPEPIPTMAESIEYDLLSSAVVRRGMRAQFAPGSLANAWPASKWRRAGGTCLNWGCIPTKALLKSAELYQKIKKAETFGITVKDVSFDFAKVMERSRGVAAQMAKGVEFLFKKNKVDYFVGRRQITVPGMVEITEGEHQGEIPQDEEHPDRDRLQDAPHP